MGVEKCISSALFAEELPRQPNGQAAKLLGFVESGVESVGIFGGNGGKGSKRYV